jgi:tetratricopeptide (TPR) repeat protein
VLALLLALLLSADPSADYEKGRALAAAGDLKGAAECLKRVTAAFPQWGLAQVELADTLVRAGADDPMTEKALAAARALEPLNPRAWMLTGLAQEKKGSAAGAIEAYARAAELRPGFLEAHERLSALLFDSGRVAEAAPHLKAVVEARADDRIARANWAEALEKSGDLEGAELQLRILIEDAPKSLPYRRRLIDFLERTGQTAKAAEETRKRDALHPVRTLRPLPPSSR